MLQLATISGFIWWIPVSTTLLCCFSYLLRSNIGYQMWPSKCSKCEGLKMNINFWRQDTTVRNVPLYPQGFACSQESTWQQPWQYVLLKSFRVRKLCHGCDGYHVEETIRYLIVVDSWVSGRVLPDQIIAKDIPGLMLVKASIPGHRYVGMELLVFRNRVEKYDQVGASPTTCSFMGCDKRNTFF